MYKLIVAGSRTFNDYDLLMDRTWQFINRLKPRKIYPEDVQIVSGAQRTKFLDERGIWRPDKDYGADYLGERFSNQELGKPAKRFVANWETHGKRAGFIRNVKMGQEGDGLLAFWDGKSAGTKHMFEVAAAHIADYNKQLVYFELERIVDTVKFV
jgi:hypothetical protein